MVVVVRDSGDLTTCTLTMLDDDLRGRRQVEVEGQLDRCNKSRLDIVEVTQPEVSRSKRDTFYLREEQAMSTDPEKRNSFSMTLDEEERATLLTMLQQALGEARVEAHRTHTPDFRDQVLHKETLIRGLIKKLQQPST
jgi:hypothetical protein